MASKKVKEWSLDYDLLHRIGPLSGQFPWVLRVTEHKDKPVPVLVVKERTTSADDAGQGAQSRNKKVLRDRGFLYGQALRRCLPVVRLIVAGVSDKAGVPLELPRFLTEGRIAFRGNLPLDEEAGAKLALLFKLQERVGDMDRVELMAWRVERFSREEAVYWMSRTSQFGEPANRWAQAGMRMMLGGQPGDRAATDMLEKIRKQEMQKNYGR